MNDEKVSHTEAVLAFIHEAKTWRDMDTDERVEWCRRVAYVLSDESTTRFGEWSQNALAPVLGVGRSTLTERLAWSSRFSDGDHDRAVVPGGRKPEHQAGDARRFFSNPAVIGERKAEIVAEALADDYVAQQVADRISRDPALLRRLERAHKALREPTESRDIPLDEAWQKWLTRLNSILTEGARLAARTDAEQVDPGVIPQVALYAYQLITEKKLDAELRVLLETEGVH